jgi:hypothetical protein
MVRLNRKHVDGSLFLFGYVDYNDQTPDDAETWTCSADTWSELEPVAEPNGEPMAGVTYDPVDSSVILLTTIYGRADCLTWAFEGGNWTQLVPSASPPALFGSTMVFDNSTADQEIVLFADGIQSEGPTIGFWNQPWLFRGGEWLNVTATSGPSPPAADGAMTYDSSDQAVLLVDAGYASNHTPAMTWEFANGSWAFLSTPSTPGFFEPGGSNLCFDAHDGYALFVLPSESQYTGELTTKTWKFDRTEIGSPPTATLMVTPRNLTEGGTVQITASASGGYGSLALLVRLDIPGCWGIERQAGSWDCTTNDSGEAAVLFVVFDQAGRYVSSLTILEISPPPRPAPSWADDAITVGVVAAGVVAAGLIAAAAVGTLNERRRRPPPRIASPSAPGAAEHPP